MADRARCAGGRSTPAGGGAGACRAGGRGIRRSDDQRPVLSPAGARFDGLVSRSAGVDVAAGADSRCRLAGVGTGGKFDARVRRAGSPGHLRDAPVMPELVDIRPLLAVLASLLCAGAVFTVRQSARWRAFWSLAAAGIKFALVWSMLPGALAGRVYVYQFGELLPGVAFGFRVDALGLFFALVSSTLWIVTTVYALAYMRGSHSLPRFFGFFALCISTTVGIAFAENLLTLFVFYELLTVCTYPLLMHDGGLKARRAGRRYLVYTLTGGALILAGMLMIWHQAGTLSLAGTGILGGVDNPNALLTIFVLLAVGFGVKAAIMPLHAWLPAAMVAPTPVSAPAHPVAGREVGAVGVP